MIYYRIMVASLISLVVVSCSLNPIDDKQAIEKYQQSLDSSGFSVYLGNAIEFQKIFTNWTNNHHIAIWVTAIIFSALHMQFYGFLPRMLLGVFCGCFPNKQLKP